MKKQEENNIINNNNELDFTWIEGGNIIFGEQLNEPINNVEAWPLIEEGFIHGVEYKEDFEVAFEIIEEVESESIMNLIINANNDRAKDLFEEGKELLFSGEEDKEAKEKFKEAYKICEDYELREEIKNSLNNTKAEILHEKGHDLFNLGRYTEAAQMYKNAYQICTEGYASEEDFEFYWHQALRFANYTRDRKHKLDQIDQAETEKVKKIKLEEDTNLYNSTPTIPAEDQKDNYDPEGLDHNNENNIFDENPLYYYDSDETISEDKYDFGTLGNNNFDNSHNVDA